MAEDAKPGRNGVDPEKLEEFFTRLDNLHDEKAEKNSEYMSDIKAVYDDASEALDLKKKNIRHEYKLHRQKVMAARKEAEMESEDKSELEILRAALGDYEDTPLGQAALEGAAQGNGADARQ